MPKPQCDTKRKVNVSAQCLPVSPLPACDDWVSAELLVETVWDTEMLAPVLSIIDYRSLAAELPRPSPEQMENFARFVSQCHSWYKHIPCLPPGVPFIFFIDPTAGLQRIVERSGRYVAAEREKSGFHYSWIPTRDYRNRFGYLAYSCKHAFQAYDCTTGATSSDLTPSIVTPNGGFAMIPTEVVEAGTVHITAVVHTLTARHAFWPERTQSGKAGLSWPEESGGLQALDKILARYEAISEDSSLIERAPRDHVDWIEDSNLYVADFVLYELLQPERQRQQRTMVAAMERVCDLLFSYGRI